MSKVVLLAVNAKYVHSSLAVWVIAAGVCDYSQIPHKVSVVEATINQQSSEIIELVAAHEPDVIGISTYIWNAAMLPGLISLLKKRFPDAIVVLGGPEASNNVNFWLEHGADNVLEGEGEYTFPQFLDELAQDRRAAHLEEDKGLAREDEDRGTVHLSCPESGFISGNMPKARQMNRPLVFESKPVNPYTAAYLDSLGGKLSYIETSRGCPYECSFCLSAETSVRYFPLDIVKEQILTLSMANTKTIKFVDRTFNCNADRACEIFEYVISLDTPCTFHFEVAADLFNARMLSILKTAPLGRIQFEIGLQSFFQPALDASSRKMNVNKAEQNIRALMDAENFHIHIDLIAGLPYESLGDFMDSFDRAYCLGAHNLQLGFLKLLHGSVLRRQAEAFGIKYSSMPPYEVISTSWLSAGDIQTLKSVENALQHTYNKGRFLSTLHYVLKFTGKRPFDLMHLLGKNVPNFGTQLEKYVVEVYDFLLTLPHIDKDELQDCMIYDWLSMVKGKNAPDFLKNDDSRRKLVAEIAESTLGRKVKREEYAVLNSSVGIFVDSSDRSPVTGLYKVYLC